MTSDDRFREAGSPFEDEEPVVFARCTPGRAVDWVDALPEHALWIPETLFSQLAALAPRSLRRLNIYAQNRFAGDEIPALLRELPASYVGGVGEALEAVRQIALECVEHRHDLLVEGP